jgi:hypothetical protein
MVGAYPELDLHVMCELVAGMEYAWQRGAKPATIAPSPPPRTGANIRAEVHAARSW